MLMLFRLVGCILILWVVTGTAYTVEIYAQSQEYPPEFIDSDFLYQNWSIRDGLPVNSISSIVQGEDGYIWMGTADGLVRFDGVRFYIYSTADHPGLRYNRLRGVVNYKNGLLILNSRSELVYMENGWFEQLEIPERLKSENFGALISEGANVSIKGRENTYSIDSEGNFRMERSTGQVSAKRVLNGQFEWTPFSKRMNYEGRLAIDFGDQINDAIIDHEGTLWVVTYSQGLYKIKRNLFDIYSEAEGVPNRNIYPVLESNDGTIWVGTHGGGIASIKEGKVTNGYLLQGVGKEAFIRSIAQRKNGEVIIAALGRGLFRYSGEKIFLKMETPDLGGVNVIFEDSDEILWVGTNSGVYYLEGKNWIYVDDPLVQQSSVIDIAEAPDGSLWFGTNGNGLLHIRNASFKPFVKEDGLSSDIIRSLWIPKGSSAENYQVWVGTEDRGINQILIRQGMAVPFEVTRIEKEDGLFDEVIHKIIPDDQGRIWMSSNRGIFWVFHNDLLEFAEGQKSEIISTRYTEQDGLRSREANGGIQPAGYKSANGSIWFPTQDGVVHVQPSIISRNTNIPQIHIEEIRSGNQLYSPVPEKFELEQGDRNIEMRFTALSFLSPEKIRFRYRLFGFDEDWIEAGDNRITRYTNLPPGSYTFKVIASNNDGVWNQQGAVVSLNVPSYFYEATWFYVLLILFFLSQMVIVFIILRNRARKSSSLKKVQINKLEDQISDLKERILNQTELKQAFLFNLKKELRDPVIHLKEQIALGRESVEKVVEREIAQLLLHVDQLLLLSQIELDGMKVNPDLEDIVSIVKQAITEHKNEAGNEDPVIEFSSNSECVNIYVDRALASIIFKSLIKYSCGKPKVSKLRVQIIEESSLCTVKFTDDGEALDHKELHSIFSLFKNMAQNAEGRNKLGITLPLVAKLVELHKATIVVHSIPEQGNTFSVAFKKGSLHFEMEKFD